MKLYPQTLRVRGLASVVIVGLISFGLLITACKTTQIPKQVLALDGHRSVETNKVWLIHEHILVDFIGAYSIDPADWDHDEVIEALTPNLEAIKRNDVAYFVDCTPAYLGRDVELLAKIAKRFDLKVITNTGFYGAGNKKFVPQFAKESTAEELAKIWTNEFKNGIDGTDIKPGFIKIGVDNTNPLHPTDKKLVEAACLTHFNTGLTIASHTGLAAGMWPQLEILEQLGISASAFIWVHAQNEPNNAEYLEAAKAGCWISLDGLGWEIENHIEKLIFAKAHNILDRILISHDAGWFDPQKKKQNLVPYTDLFEVVIPRLLQLGFTKEDIDLLLVKNPIEAFAVRKRTI